MDRYVDQPVTSGGKVGVLIRETFEPPRLPEVLAGGKHSGVDPCLKWSLRGRVGHKGSPLDKGVSDVVTCGS